jgi:2-pyrone-4,6-dicarboxylate lactonase
MLLEDALVRVYDSPKAHHVWNTMTKDDIPVCPPPDPAPHTPSFEVPPGATDCHAHVFQQARYPYQETRAYTPPDATISDLKKLHAALGLRRLVVVQASAHGVDNSAIRDAIATDPANIRGICAVPPDISERELVQLHEAGMRGIRINLVDKGGMPFRSLDDLGEFSRRIADLGWHIELLVHAAAESAELKHLVGNVHVPLSVGHAGYTKTAAGGLRAPGFADFLAMMRDGHFWVKLTAPYRLSTAASTLYDDVQDMMMAVVDAAPERILWGSDWPHVMVYDGMPNDGDLMDLLAAWIPDPTVRHRVLVENPVALYGF